MLDTVKALCALSGVSGWEDEVRDYILERAMPCAQEISTDAMGNLYIFKKGRIAPARPLMVCAHMDEVGILVTGYREDGSLRFDFVGGIDRRVVLGKRVYLGPERRLGVIGLKAVHLVPKEERDTVPRQEELYVDIGAEDETTAKELVPPGTRGTFDPGVVCFGDGYIKAKALDDRVGCAAMLKLLEEELPADAWFVFTVQEEVGCRGAVTAANRLRPGGAIVLEGTTAADIPGVEEGNEVCFLGRGLVIPFMDRGTIYDPALLELAAGAAQKSGTPWQTKSRVAGGTDASAIQRSGEGVKVLTVSVPLRNIHSPASLGRAEDMLLMPGYCRCLLEEMARGC